MTGAFGRDGFIKMMWETLEEKSVQLLGERRTGKTTVIQAMAQTPPKNTIALFRDLEDIGTPEGFTKAVREMLIPYSPIENQAVERSKDLRNLIGEEISLPGGIKIGKPTAENWNEVLHQTLEAINREANSHNGKFERVIFLWDEVPFMLHKIRQTRDEKAAMEVLDTLRHLQQTYGRENGRIRFVFTGSIGLHHVLTGLKEAGYANAPTNDFAVITLPPLESYWAKDLAELELKERRVTVRSPETVAKRIAEVTDGLPFYIREIVRACKQRGTDIDADDIDTVVQQIASDPTDPVHLGYYVERIKTYYKPERSCNIAWKCLDVVSLSDIPLPLNDILQRVKQSGIKDAKEEELRSVLRLLEQDLYLIYTLNGYTFHYKFIGRVWPILRRLGG
jgi:AAA+ ATPase superfamily predicted ATPase